jgi:RNA polymerase sigma-70 factor, ECF subfamily
VPARKLAVTAEGAVGTLPAGAQAMPANTLKLVLHDSAEETARLAHGDTARGEVRGPRRSLAAIDFVDLVRAHEAALLARALHLTNDRDVALDLVQDTFERCLRRYPTCLPRDKTRNWLLVVLHNLFIDEVRLARNRGRTRGDTALERVPVPLGEEPPRSSCFDAEDIARWLPTLSPEVVAAYRLHCQGLSYKAIAAALAIPVPTVGTRVLRARRYLREALNRARPPIAD